MPLPGLLAGKADRLIRYLNQQRNSGKISPNLPWGVTPNRRLIITNPLISNRIFSKKGVGTRLASPGASRTKPGDRLLKGGAT